MNGNNNNNVALLTHQFQNLNCLGHDTPPPPPPQSLPPTADAECSPSAVDSSCVGVSGPVSDQNVLNQNQLQHLQQGHGHHHRQVNSLHHAEPYLPLQNQEAPSQTAVSQTVLYHNQQLTDSQTVSKAHYEHVELLSSDMMLVPNALCQVPILELANGEKQLSCLDRLLNDLHRLVEDNETADIVFLAEPTEIRIHAHSVILHTRCKSFQNRKRGEICKIYGTTVFPAKGNNNNKSFIRWPQVKANTLRDVLQFVYTAKIQIREDDIFEALAIAFELGLNELAAICEQHAQASIAVHNAFQHLDALLTLESRLSVNDWNRMMQTCLQFICEHAPECVNTPSFLNLSKLGMTYLVSSDYFSLEESDVFRWVLAWAKHQTGVLQPPEQWTSDERASVQQQLAGVIDHIRILLIDEQVFAQEVETTGVVPVELSLQRYRYAVLKHGQQDNNNNRLISRRMSHPKRLFVNSKLITGKRVGEYEHLLNSWFGVPKQPWKLIFRASLHHFSADAFHDHCDGVSPTFVVVLSTTGYLAGGFIDVPWARDDGKGRGRYASSEKAFLFSLESLDPNAHTPARFDIKKKMFAIAHHANFGPVFGAGADLSISDQCHMNEKSYSNLPHSYDGENASCCSLFGDYNFTVIDYEVFTLAD